jgi:hypothetical protein
VKSVVGWLRLKISIASDQKESLFRSSLITFAPFILLLARISSAVAHSTPLRLYCGAYGIETSIHRLVDRWFYFYEGKVLHRPYVWLVACCYIADTVRRSFLVMWFSCCLEYLLLKKIRFYCLSVPQNTDLNEPFAYFSVSCRFYLNQWKVLVLSVCFYSCVFTQLIPYG